MSLTDTVTSQLIIQLTILTKSTTLITRETSKKMKTRERSKKSVRKSVERNKRVAKGEINQRRSIQMDTSHLRLMTIRLSSRGSIRRDGGESKRKRPMSKIHTFICSIKSQSSRSMRSQCCLLVIQIDVKTILELRNLTEGCLIMTI